MTKVNKNVAKTTSFKNYLKITNYKFMPISKNSNNPLNKQILSVEIVFWILVILTMTGLNMILMYLNFDLIQILPYFNLRSIISLICLLIISYYQTKDLFPNSV